LKLAVEQLAERLRLPASAERFHKIIMSPVRCRRLCLLWALPLWIVCGH
jgi:hypothetical protein